MDILVVLRSFLPKGGRIDRVTVYLSDFGLQRMAEEAALGPQVRSRASMQLGGAPVLMKDRDAARYAMCLDQGIYTKKAKGAADDAAVKELSEVSPRASTSWCDRTRTSRTTTHRLTWLAVYQDVHGDGGGGSDSGGEVDQRRLRLYERSKLRYFYAIVECDAVATAAALYDECDGMEFGRSACRLDLRFVPDEQVRDRRSAGVHTFPGRTCMSTTFSQQVACSRQRMAGLGWRSCTFMRLAAVTAAARVRVVCPSAVAVRAPARASGGARCATRRPRRRPTTSRRPSRARRCSTRP